MKPEADLERDIQRGERARQLLNDPMLRDAIDKMRETTYHNIRTSNFKQIDEREECYKMLKAIDHFEDEFTRIVNGGKKAKSLIKKLLKGN